MKSRKSKMGKIIFLVGFLFVLIPVLSVAQQYPTRPVNLIVNFAPGGSTDLACRILASKAEKFLGQPIVIMNMGGGGGTVGLGIFAKKEPDGYNLAGVTSTGLIILPELRALSYKFEDFVPVLHFATMRTGLVVKADSPWKTLKELVDYAKKNPGKVTYGTPGTSTTVHIAMEYIGKQEGIQWTHVPFQGTGPATTALLGGHTTATSGDLTNAPHIREGSLRLLVTYEEKRTEAFPSVPTLLELGYDFSNVTLFMVVAPNGTPPSIVEKVDDAFRKGMDDPEFLQTMAKLQLEPSYRNHTDAKKYLEGAYHFYKRIIRELNIPKQPVKE